MQQKHVISCDWGTSSLRLQLIDTASLRCLAKVSSGDGNALIFNQWKEDGKSDRVHFYLRRVQHLLNELSASAGIPVNELDIIISGMASSSVGIKELPYADVPFNLDGTTALTERIDGKSIIDNPLLLISGVQQADDVMRGEETQLIGISSLLDLREDDNLLFILPGTHSKHILVKNNSIIHFRTFMTGEIFEMVAKYTVLSHAVTASRAGHVISEKEISSFSDGVNRALSSELLNSLFSVRINQLKKYLTPEENYYYLSGLLIGSELKHIINNNQKLVLCSSGSLLQLYRLAIATANLSERSIIVPEEVLDNAAAAGQLKIFNNIKSI